MATALLMTLESTLRDAVTARIESGQATRYAVTRDAGVGTFTLKRWLDSHTDIKTSTASRLAEYLGLALAPAIEGIEPSIEKQLRAHVEGRLAAGESKYAIAKGAGVAQQTILQWLRDDRDIAFSTADKLAEYLGLTLEPSPGE